MTDQPPPTNPGDIWVTGQRRQANGLFPAPGGGGGGGGGEGGTTPDIRDEEAPEVNPEAQPCPGP